jgi:erythromycin esterase-like protein
VQGVERIWLWLKNRHTKENAMQMVAIFQERLVVIDRLLREQHAKQRY